ncbi:MAG: MerR family transcriptional regulator [Oscillospiraceae bacterium]|nr:MerR family transcriptional regulator [Oscillospiraceae bacterium]
MAESELLSIKEFAQFTGVRESTLRYYDEIGLFHPAKRGEENDYRYYSTRQIVFVNMINVLRGLDIPIKRLRTLTEDRTPEKIIELIKQKERDLDAELLKLQNSYAILHTFMSNIEDGLNANVDAIEVQHMDELSIIRGDDNDFGNHREFYKPLLEFYHDAQAHGLDIAFPVGGLFDSMDDFMRTPSQPSRFFFVTPFGVEKKPEGDYLVGYTRGYYGVTHDLSERMYAYAKEHKLNLVGPMYNIYLHDEISEFNPECYLMQASIQVGKPAKR